MINPTDPAFPVHPQQTAREEYGLTIRTELAARNMAAILAGDHAGRSTLSTSTVIKRAIEHADALMAELNKEEK